MMMQHNFTLSSSQKMTSDPKKHRIDDQAMEVDRISNLPRHLITCILDCLDINDVARTSVLSKTWKDIWETHPHMALAFSQSKFLLAVNSILFTHRGPILRFSLYIPPNLQLHSSPYPHFWIKKLSEKGVKNLKLVNSTLNPISNIPSYFFYYSELESLTLTYWKLNPPLKFGGFRKLVSIALYRVTFAAEILFGTQVEMFRLSQCAGIEHLDSQLTKHGRNLKILDVYRSVPMERHYAAAFGYNPFTDTKKSFNLHRLLGDMHNIQTLTLETTCLQYLNPGPTLHNQLGKTMEKLKKLELYDIAFNDMYGISNTMCLLRSMPNLEDLMITVGDHVESRSHTELTTEQYLESPDCANIIMNRLLTVEMSEIMGSRAEILFIKLLLASSPSIRSMTLERKYTMRNVKENDRIVRELLQFPRKSQVEIFWQ